MLGVGCTRSTGAGPAGPARHRPGRLRRRLRRRRRPGREHPLHEGLGDAGGAAEVGELPTEHLLHVLAHGVGVGDAVVEPGQRIPEPARRRVARRATRR